MSDLSATADEMMGYIRGKRDELARIVALARSEADSCADIYGTMSMSQVEQQWRDFASALERGEL